MENLKPFFDLSISEKCFAEDKYNNVIKRLYNFGYRTIAINQVVDDANFETKKKKKKGESRENVDIVPAPIEIKKVEGCDDMTILNRLTIVFGNQESMHKITRSPLYRNYHLIAILPTTQAAFQFTCSNIDADILTFDPENKTPIKMNRRTYNQLIEKGYHFEILYAPAIADTTQRRNMIHMSHLYHMFGKSRNIIFSSGATHFINLRGPYDIINLGLIFGLSEAQSKNAISHCARNVCISAVGRRHGKVIMFVENLSISKHSSEGDDNKNDDRAADDDDDDEEEMDVDQPALKKIKC